MTVSLPAHEVSTLSGEVAVEALPVAAVMLFGTNGVGAETDAAGNLKLVTGGGVLVGTEGNLWNAATVGAGGNSAAIAFPAQHRLAVFGHASAATTLSLQYSADGTNFYTVNQVVLSVMSDFAIVGLTVPAGLTVRLQSSAAATITATALGSD